MASATLLQYLSNRDRGRFTASSALAGRKLDLINLVSPSLLVQNSSLPQMRYYRMLLRSALSE